MEKNGVGCASSPVATIKSKDIIHLYKKDYGVDVGRYFHGVDEIEVCKDLETELLVYKPAVFGDNVFYEDLYSKFSGYNIWKWEFEYAEKFIEKGSSVLEVGCGEGFFLERIKERLDVIVQGVDFNTDAMQKAKKKGLDCVGDIDDVDVDRQYDVVCCFQVLEHIPDHQAFLRKLLGFVKQGGKLILAVPNNNPFLYGYDIMHTLNLPPHHLALWNKQSLEAICSWSKDFAVLETKTEPLSIGEVEAYIEAYQSYFGSLNLKYFILRYFVPKKMWIPLSELFKIEGRNIATVLIKG